MNLKLISSYRSCLMGFAILWIVFYHYAVPLVNWNGDLGVDIFFFLSAVGLSFSLQKNPGIKHFYLRRFRRILPVWWLLISLHLLMFILRDMPHPQTLYQYFCYYTGVGWLFHPQGSGTYYCEWYVPTLLSFYVLTPWLYRCNVRLLAGLLTGLVLLGYTLSFLHVMHPLDRGYLRLPVFISGIIYFKLFRDTDTGKTPVLTDRMFNGLGCLGFMGIVLLDLFHGPENLRYLFFLLALPALCKVLILFFRKIRLVRFLSWVGTFTLELYLVHIYGHVVKLMFYAFPAISHDSIILVLALAFSLLSAYAIHQFVTCLMKIKIRRIKI